jgi:hypothetical protein
VGVNPIQLLLVTGSYLTELDYSWGIPEQCCSTSVSRPPSWRCIVQGVLPGYDDFILAQNAVHYEGSLGDSHHVLSTCVAVCCGLLEYCDSTTIFWDIAWIRIAVWWRPNNNLAKAQDCYFRVSACYAPWRCRRTVDAGVCSSRSGRLAALFRIVISVLMCYLCFNLF